MRISIPRIDYVPSLPPSLAVSIEEAASRIAEFLENGKSSTESKGKGKGKGKGKTMILCGAGVSVDRCVTRPVRACEPTRREATSTIRSRLTGLAFFLSFCIHSGIRAYRGKGGSYNVNRSYRPVFFHEFVANEYFRQRYWARSFLGGVGLRVGSSKCAEHGS